MFGTLSSISTAATAWRAGQLFSSIGIQREKWGARWDCQIRASLNGGR